jgi:hypothetical protein
VDGQSLREWIEWDFSRRDGTWKGERESERERFLKRLFFFFFFWRLTREPIQLSKQTLQTIAFLAYLCEKGTTGPFLIVCPLSVLSNWITEFQKFAPDIPVRLACIFQHLLACSLLY